ncbi:MAG: polysulfide reductase NrfD [Elusimicrobia bacterium]|nr:polysulfide reductase NrfD [Elusimicrobiota bacterium]
MAPEVLTAPGMTPAALDERVLAFPQSRPPISWFAAFAFTASLAGIGLLCIAYTLYTGIGAWGNNRPVVWAFDIINFVFWIGIGHAGTLISAILLMFRARWRNSISRFAEAMTIFAVICAGLFPLLHLGRPWVNFWLFPYPNQRGLWPNFRSPLMWDVFAVSTYFSVSLLFWYLGLIPDIASMRDRAKGWRKLAYTALSLGWTGATSHWQHYEKAYTLLAGLATGLVLSVHSVVSFDFAVSLVPGWHMTIFPPYFVVGAIFSGFAMVILGLLVVRSTMGLRDVITDRHLDLANKVMLATACLMGYSYLLEGFTAWYSMNPHIHHAFMNYVSGAYGWAGWIAIAGNVLIPQLLWSAKARRSPLIMAGVAVSALVGMWFERFVIIVISLHQDFLPSSWGLYFPTIVDFGILFGSFGMFFSMVLLFSRLLPVVATTELKADMPQAGEARHG